MDDKGPPAIGGPWRWQGTLPGPGGTWIAENARVYSLAPHWGVQVYARRPIDLQYGDAAVTLTAYDDAAQVEAVLMRLIVIADAMLAQAGLEGVE